MRNASWSLRGSKIGYKKIYSETDTPQTFFLRSVFPCFPMFSHVFMTFKPTFSRGSATQASSGPSSSTVWMRSSPLAEFSTVMRGDYRVKQCHQQAMIYSIIYGIIYGIIMYYLSYYLSYIYITSWYYLWLYNIQYYIYGVIVYLYYHD